MFKRIFIIFIVLCTMLLGCSKKQIKTIVEEDKPSPPPIVDPIYEDIKKLTLDEKIGQLFIVSMDGEEVNESTIRLIKDNKIGGIILFQKNIKDSKQLVTLVNLLKETNKDNPISLFLSIDEEGGRVTRMPKEIKKLPSSKLVGKTGKEEIGYDLGVALGEELRDFGINMNFAPVMDINNNPNNKVIGDRAFGDNPQTVGSLGRSVMKGLQNADIIPVLKHFPGHGDTAVDSHVDLPLINKTMESLESFEIIPFKEGIEEGADMVMMGHILLPLLDKENPATLSSIIIKDLLREKLQFNGVVITDDISMKAISNKYGVGESGLKALKAGSDIVLSCYSSDKQFELIKYVKDAVSSGLLSEEEIDKKVYRIIKLKKKYNISDEVVKQVNVNVINEKVSSVIERIGR